MQFTNLIISGVFLLVLLVGLFYTLQVGRQMEKRQSEYDTEVSEKVEKRPYIRNPIFIAYIVLIAFALFYIFYISFSTTW
ncbi:hypothetical protein P9246_13420 [Aeribacillus pallidus]|uniref:hypothetical protein n=1 Tax=Aeribacillus TaxID=1055323 RepID=UPI0007B4A1BA|nr:MULTISPECIES: hypothetical protein [Aeribacillus]KZM56251.1 hypothetical protein A3Q35_09385 [Aeribacillus pallidus]MED0652168.1 hypothetical protein [Aeribacillus composti]MED4487730.1 hypothetical protein [Aeribacillus pallidus]